MYRELGFELEFAGSPVDNGDSDLICLIADSAVTV